VEASRWILENIPGPLNLLVETDGLVNSNPINVFNNRIVEKGAPVTIDLKIKSGGTSSMITAPQLKLVGSYAHFWISVDEEGKEKISEARWVISDDEGQESLIIKTGETELKSGNPYFLHYRLRNNTEIAFDGIKIKRANQDDISFDVNLAFENQEPGIYVGKSEFIADQDLKINEIVLQNFQQKFNKSTAIFRVSILNEDDENSPLSVSEKKLQFTEPGIRLSEEFPFPPISLEENKVYKVKLDLVEGDAIQLLAENFTLETSWDDSLPLGVDGYNIGGIYSAFNLELYGADTPEKRDRMIEILDQSEYIIVPSNRGYDAMPRLVTRYPLTLRYYQLLFDCDCSGDEMEKWAYALEPYFSSPLGFELIETFVSHPNIGPIQINDQNADESFTVYDHPKVFIFKKSESFSIERVKQALLEVDLEDVVFQRPIDVSKAPNGLKLSSDRLEVQTNGGTWSEIFNRSSLINQNSILMVVIWYILILIIGWMVLPLTNHIFASLPDKGYSFIRMLGLVILTWLSWFSGSLKILPFTRGTILIFILLLVVLNLFWLVRRKQAILDFICSNLGYIILVESIFLLLFIFGLQIRYANPDLWHPWYGGEKPMEFAFFNAVNKSVYFPPQNPWFSEHYINYYYYGFIIAAIPTKLLGILPASAFNLILPTWFAMTGIGLFGVGYNFYSGFAKKKENIEINHIENNLNNRKKWGFRISPIHKSALFVGFFALIFILFFGNFFQVKLLWQNLPEVSKVIQDAESDNKLVSVLSGAKNVISGEAELPGSPGRWYFSASRPILPDGPDTPIAEFPYFSFLYGDLHPHLLTMPFYALGFGWCLTLLLGSFHKQKWYQQILPLVFAGFIFGMYRVSHTWDFPIFIGLGTLSLIWMISKDKTLLLENQIRKILIYTVIFIGLSIILYLPFSQWFKTAYNSIEIWDGARTPLKDYFIVFGMSIFIMFGFLLDEIKTDVLRIIKSWKKLQLGQLMIPFVLILISVAGSVALWKFNFQVLAFGWPLIIGWIWIIFIKKRVGDFRKLIWILFAGGYLITFVVEVVVLKGDVGRNNMVFRMYNLAWFILGLAMSLGLIEIRKNLKNWPKTYEFSWLFIFVILLFLGLTYQITATDKKMNDRWPNVVNPPKTLDGSLFMLGNHGSEGTNSPAIYKENEVDLDLGLDYEGITFMQDNIVGSPVIVEGHTSEYRWGGRYAIHTGLPSVIGWSWHTRQHNSLLDRAVVDRRIEQVNEFYNTTDLDIARKFLEKYRVQYIIVSGLERALYTSEGLEKFKKMVESGQLSILYGGFSSDTALIFGVN
jgi:YYY domain-containing protein